MGVLAQEDMAEGERTRLARRKVKKAVIGGQSWPYFRILKHVYLKVREYRMGFAESINVAVCRQLMGGGANAPMEGQLGDG